MRRDVVWRSSGLQLLARSGDGRLAVTPEFLMAYLGRPELRPLDESGGDERAYHARLVEDPLRTDAAARLGEIEDADARENFAYFISFRDLLAEAGTIDAAYVSLVRGVWKPLPPLFASHLAHILIGDILADSEDPFRFRAGEIFFRDQAVTLFNEVVLLADDEIVEMTAATDDGDVIGKLLKDPQALSRQVEIDVMSEDTKADYWARADRFDMAIDFRFTQPPVDAFARVLERWVLRLLGVEVRVEPVPAIRDERWSWHVGLDTEASRLLDKLYEGGTLTDEESARILGLFRLTFTEPSAMLPRVAGRPVYLALAMTEKRKVRMKPQNLVVNLPLARPS